jgi:hypothetical protein
MSRFPFRQLRGRKQTDFTGGFQSLEAQGKMS